MIKRSDIENKRMGLMRSIRLMRLISLMRLIGLMGLMMLLALPQVMMAQDDAPEPIIVNGNIYGGGNKGKVGGNTTVNVRAGDLNKVFGGARMANVGGRSFVNIEGEHATDYTVINYVFGGNDIAGTIGTSTVLPEELTDVVKEKKPENIQIPDPLPEGKTEEQYKAEEIAKDKANQIKAGKNDINNTWNAYVRISDPGENNTRTVKDAEKSFNADLTKKKEIYIGQLFGGGNGEYEYVPQETNEADEKTYDVYLKPKTNASTAIATITVPKNAQNKFIYKPELAKTYLEIKGGSIVYAYGGGNNATVTEKTVIYVNNPSDVVNHIEYKEGNTWKDKLTNTRFKDDMGINTGFSYPSSAEFQIGRFFGGNNMAEMAIMPTWNLQSGKIRNLYSGGNRGAMTNQYGMLLDIYPNNDASNNYGMNLIIDNVYGGCRMADVRPLEEGTSIEDKTADDVENITFNPLIKDKDGDDYHFPDGYSARVIVRGGDINNVYGGNDITGHVYGGNAVGIRSSIRGDVYGGGNGSYPYTDNPALENDDIFGDIYYNPITLLGLTEDDGEGNEIEATSFTGFQSVEALNKFRPNAEKVSLRLWGKDAANPTIIGGSVYVGGNSATLRAQSATRGNTRATTTVPPVHLKVGSHVIVENTFLGNNGENMIATTPEVQDANHIITRHGGVLWSYKNKENFTHINLASTDTDPSTGKTQMDLYMDGVAMSIIPDIVFDTSDKNGGTDADDYKSYSSYFGSFFCGGNMGSMTYSGTNTMNFDVPVIVYNKLVGGCNKADVPVLYASDDPNKEKPLNIPYQGGILGDRSEWASDGLFRANKATNGAIQNRLILNLGGEVIVEGKKEIHGLKIEPKRLNFTEVTSGTLTAGGKYYTLENGKYHGYTADGTEIASADDVYYQLTKDYTFDAVNGSYLIWNTAKLSEVYDAVEIGKTKAIGRKYYTSATGEGGTVAESATTVDNNSTYELNYEYEQIGVGSSSDTGNDAVRRLLHGNIYGGCYNSGHVNGNIVININKNLVERDEVFADTKEIDKLDENDQPIIENGQNVKETVIDDSKKRNSGVILDRQSNDEMSVAMTVFGAGMGEETEIWGSTTVNLNKGYAFQVFGGGEQGVVGKKEESTGDYVYNAAYSTTVNLNGNVEVYNETDRSNKELAEAEFIYGAGNEGDICGDSKVYLGTGRVYDVFGGASDANILGHTEVYIGKNSSGIAGFPWVRDIVYGGNDFGGTIHKEIDFSGKVRVETGDEAFDVKSQIYNPGNKEVPEVLKAKAYVEYLEGRVDTIFGGCYGYYDYSKEMYKYEEVVNNQLKWVSPEMPNLESTFVNIRPVNNEHNGINAIFGAGTGYPGNREGDNTQDRSYVLIDIPQAFTNFTQTNIFGAGAYNGLGMKVDEDTNGDPAPLIRMAEVAEVANPGEGATAAQTAAYEAYTAYTDYLLARDKKSAIIDLVRGQVGNAYGGSYNEGITRNTIINVPEESTIKIGNIFGGAYGTLILPPCDVYESNVFYKNTSENARVTGNIYGGNNNERRTLFTRVDISAPVWSNKDNGYLARVYGAGKGLDTWSEYTEVNLLPGAKVYEAYGGGQLGHVLNTQSVQTYMRTYAEAEHPSEDIAKLDPKWKKRWIYNEGTKTWGWKAGASDDEVKEWKKDWAKDWQNAWTLGAYYIPSVGNTDANLDYSYYVSNTATNLSRVNPRPELSDKTATFLGDGTKKFNTNVIVHTGAHIEGYAYGGGWGDGSALSGDVYGLTYFALLGGSVKQDIYAAGTSGSIDDLFGVGAYDATKNPNGFTASANVYIQGGTARNVYGGGWKGAVGYHPSVTVPKGAPHMTNIKGTPIDSTFIYAGPTEQDVLGVTNVVVGILPEDLPTNPKAEGEEGYDPDFLFHNGIPAIQRNVYGGGEGGSIYGTANLTIFNGYVGYRYDGTATDDENTTELNEKYVEELFDDREQSIDLAGNAFGGGYVTNSYVDTTVVKMYGGILRGSLYGGGEIGPVGRGTLEENIPIKSGENWSFGTAEDLSGSGVIKTMAVDDKTAKIYKAGATHIYMYGGHVMRDVFGGGRGYSSWGNDGYRTDPERYGKDLSAKGYIFGTTEVNIHYGEIGTAAGVASGYGNVFGGGNAGFVFSGNGTKATNTDNGKTIGYYYDKQNKMTEDCCVDVRVYGKSKVDGLQFTHTFKVDELISGEMKEKVIATYPNYASKINADNRINTPFEATLTYNKGDFIHNRMLNDLAYYDGGEPTEATETTPATYGNEGRWTNIDQTGILIHNAVFAGGNVMTGSSEVFAYSKTVFGNATAAIVDAYSRDLTTVGGNGVGGLYGDGNITYVDGYRELNITNYGTDYFSLPGQLDLTKDADKAKYDALSNRQKAFYSTKYQLHDKATVSYQIGTGTDAVTYNYSKGDIITGEDYDKLFKQENGTYSELAADWTPKHSVINEGRYINTIQRADFCGIKGSRLVLRGAIDRAQDKNEADYTPYTINRVKELSLNQNNVPTKKPHGCYFGIYSSVKLLGAVTSDVLFDDVRKTDSDKPENRNADGCPEYGTPQATYKKWKEATLTAGNRNNGSSANKIALASGVYLELIDHYDQDGNKVYGPITGVVELDLLNVTPGEGGGYVYAENIHGVQSYDTSELEASVLSDANKGLITNKAFHYAAAVEGNDMQTSGNFVHSLKRIIDDCFPMAHSYLAPNAAPAHYWYIRGEFFVYEQLVSAYTGGADAYSTEISIPLTLSAQGNGHLRLLNVLPGLYADPSKFDASQGYYDEELATWISPDSIRIITESAVKSYGQNDPISYWDWYMSNTTDRERFVLQTYNCREQVIVQIGTGESATRTTYYPGQGITPAIYNGLTNATVVDEEGHTIYDDNSQPVKAQSYFNLTNVVSTDSAYVLTLDMSNPDVWNDHYTCIEVGDGFGTQVGTVITTKEYNRLLNACVGDDAKEAFKAKYIKSATFKCTKQGTYGQYYFTDGTVVSQAVLDMQDNIDETTKHLDTQAKFATNAETDGYVGVYVAKAEVDLLGKTYHKNNIIAPGDYKQLSAEEKEYFEPGYICIGTIQVGPKDYRVLNEVIGETEYTGITDSNIKGHFQKAYYCMRTGSWGGKLYYQGQYYSAVDYCQVLPQERENFEFTYDALDLLVTDYYDYFKYTTTEVDGKTVKVFNPNDSFAALKHYAENGGTKRNDYVSRFDGTLTSPRYSVSIPVDYTATFKGTDNFQMKNGNDYIEIKKKTSTDNATELTCEEFETLPNDRLNYAAFNVTENNKGTDGDYHVYIVKKTFDVGGVMYNAGMVLKKSDYDDLGGTTNENLAAVTITQDDLDHNIKTGEVGGANNIYHPFFYCFVQEEADGTYKYTTGANQTGTPRYKVGEKDGNVKEWVPNGETGTWTALTAQSFSDIEGNSYSTDGYVSQGTVLNYENFISIYNYQDGFEIKGETPVEEATLYVPVTAKIDDLQKDRYVTVIYEYTYTESDNQGLSYETRVEKHIINLRIQFESGAPHIGPIKEPGLVLPLEAIGIEPPMVEEGAFPVIASGWQIFPSEEAAKKHTNGREFANNAEPVYYYQNNYYVDYYAETRMGRTFSNHPVRVKVGNYHRMADVINDAHHMYINHRDLDKTSHPQPDPKIYIDSRTVGTKGEGNEQHTYNELDALQDLWTIVNGTYGTNGTASGLTDTGTNYGRDITGAKKLDFYLQSEVTTSLNTWTPIGDDNTCFQGRFHGNGNTVKGLSGSLFGKLCGEVYNTGVMGRFTSGGIADGGSGRVENCWVSSDAATKDNDKFAVVGNPTDMRVINSYYPEEDGFKDYSTDVNNDVIKKRPYSDFLNGSVAYDLNRYYLEARYRLMSKADKETSGSKKNWTYFRLPDGTIKQEPKRIADSAGKEPGMSGYVETYEQIADATGKKPGETGYETTYAMANEPYDLYYTEEDFVRFAKTGSDNVGYVGHYYDDGDFRFSDGLKPHTADMRLDDKYGYIPIYPDDYIFFGQKLTYDILKDHVGAIVSHASHPQGVTKSHTTGSSDNVDNSKNGLLLNDATDIRENRIYRAPAYFRNGNYGESVLFNANAAFADSYTLGTESYHIHHNLTAVDLNGGNGDTQGYQGVVAGLRSDFKSRSDNYKPLLDFERLDGIVTNGITQNLLVYAPRYSEPNTKNQQTISVLRNYFNDQTYSEHELNTEETPEQYHAVRTQTRAVHGHVVVQQTAASPTTTTDAGSPITYTYQSRTDQFLVDKNDFNAPMEYTFYPNTRMWYQRTPDNYAGQKTVTENEQSTIVFDENAGWEGVSIPFEAEIVTTNQKGEITHFYRKDASGTFEKGYNSGHEYWLRGFEGGEPSTKAGEGDIFIASFLAPLKDGSVVRKTDTNTFLWDYYYKKNASEDDERGRDKNEDRYQKEYYKTSREYNGYPRLAKAKPYIIGFPGEYYYEFDLSGKFEASTAHATLPEKLNRQVITFAATPSTEDVPLTIAKSDGEKTGITKEATISGKKYSFTFTPSYLNEEYKEDAANTFVLNSTGESFDWVDVTDDVPVVRNVAFRPYFTGSVTNAAPRRIIIGSLGDTSLQPDIDEHHNGSLDDGGLKISVDKRYIVVESTLRENAKVRITTTSGLTVATFTIEPGQIVRTPVNMTGVYMVNRTKLLVK